MPYALLLNRALNLALAVAALFVGAIALFVAVAPAASASTTSGPHAGTGTYAAQQAAAFYDRLSDLQKRETTTSKRSRTQPMGYLPRLRALAQEFGPVLSSTSIKGRRGAQVDADSMLLFWTGSNHNAACLDLRYGTVTNGHCGARAADAKQGLVDIYTEFIASAIWFDRNHADTGLSIRQTSLIGMLADDFSDRVSVDYRDAEVDGIVDGALGGTSADAVVTLRTATECAYVSLPKQRPADGAYEAYFTYC